MANLMASPVPIILAFLLGMMAFGGVAFIVFGITEIFQDISGKNSLPDNRILNGG